ncbi:MAG: hypothetical protein HWE14_00800 [Flavobacteriia bacterium]|nr:hypothetical protein [Flavobacteriia bacterium]
MRKSTLLLATLLFSLMSYAQGWPEIRRITDSAEYRAMEPMVDSCISYLHHTMPQDDPIGRSEAVKFLDDWITGVPYILITQREYLFKATGSNQELMTQHVAGKMYYLRSHPAVPVDSYSSELNGVLWMIELYQSGAFPTTTEMDALVNMMENGTLEEWLRNQMPKDWTQDSNSNE